MNRGGTLLVVALVALVGCGDDDSQGSDGGLVSDAGPIYDAALNQDGTLSLSWVDFTISGCASGGQTLPGPGGDAGPSGDAGVTDPCYGIAPLDLQFTAVAPAPVEVYVWNFGDTETSDEASPEHTYSMPGAYDVSLTVGGQGTADVLHPMAVIVEHAPLGFPCTADEQCDDARDCVCDDMTLCPASLTGGLCTNDCDDQSPCAEGVCANLAPTAPITPTDWQRSMCLPSCADNDCPGDLVCREVLAGDGPGWIEACFAPGLLGDIGDSCADVNGDPDDEACTSGVCLDEGARGICSESCIADSCPDSAACATFVDGLLGSWCLASCEDVGDCTDDPFLVCNAPGGTGDKDFTVDEMPPAAMGYCAPKPCTMPSECGIQGTCTDGFCASP